MIVFALTLHKGVCLMHTCTRMPTCDSKQHRGLSQPIKTLTGIPNPIKVYFVVYQLCAAPGDINYTLPTQRAAAIEWCDCAFKNMGEGCVCACVRVCVCAR